MSTLLIMNGTMALGHVSNEAKYYKLISLQNTTAILCKVFINFKCEFKVIYNLIHSEMYLYFVAFQYKAGLRNSGTKKKQIQPQGDCGDGGAS